MRSKLGTKARLAAHITALILLILMLVYLGSPQGVNDKWAPGSLQPAAAAAPGPASTLDKVVAPAQTQPVPEEQLRPPAPPEETGETESTVVIHEPPIPGPPAPEPEQPQPAEPEEKEPVAEPEPEPEPTPEPDPVAPPAEEPAAPETETPPEPEEAPAEPESEAEPIPETPPAAQPDESGSLVVAASETGAEGPVAASAPLANANLQVLGDGVYWLDPSHDLEKELAAIPEVGSLILLTPLPGYRVEGFEHVKTVAIPADSGDLTRDAAEHFLYVTDESRQPVVAAALPGARGAAYFKGAYLLLKRNMGLEEVLREVAPELEEAGEAREEIEHRLSNLDAQKTE